MVKIHLIEKEHSAYTKDLSVKSLDLQSSTKDIIDKPREIIVVGVTKETREETGQTKFLNAIKINHKCH